MSRGELRIYVGAAPGVGKTFAMLNEGWRRKQRGTDVVVGYVEDHGRPATAAQVRDLEVIPRATLSHRGQQFEEMDGLDVVRGLRGWTSVPIVVLSGRGSEKAKVDALDLGADDYLTKPFGMDELFARLRAALRRAVAPDGQPVMTTVGLHHRLRREAGPPGRCRDPPDSHPVAHRGGARPQRRSTRDVRTAAPRGVGADLRQGDELPAASS